MAALDDRPAPPAEDSLESRRLRARVRQRLFGRETAPTRLGRYQLGRLIGTGGMGSVYAGTDPVLERSVAIKVLHDRSTEITDRLRREARALAVLSHPHVVPVYDLASEGDRSFVVMELIDGEPLRHVPERPIWRTLELLVEAGRGLAAAHAANLCHRDFKPSNVLVGEDGRVRVVDFGLAQLARHPPAPAPAAALADSTSTAGGGGTPAYMAPEQMRDAATERSDQFAFCVTALEILHGQRPFPTAPLSRRLQAIDAGATVPPNTAVPPAILAVLSRGLRRDPSARHRNMNALLVALERARRPPRWRAVALTTVGMVFAAAWGVSNRAPSTPLCAGSESLAARWTLPSQPDARLRAAAADYSRRFDVAVERACAMPDRDARLSCLAPRSLVASSSPMHSASDVSVLPDPEPCLRSSTHQTQWHDETRRSVIDHLARAERAHGHSRYAAAWAMAIAADAIAMADGSADLRAKSQLGLATIARSLRDYARARDYATTAYDLAVEANDDPTAARAAIETVATIGLTGRLSGPGSLWARHADAAVTRAEEPHVTEDLARTLDRIEPRAAPLFVNATDLSSDEALLFREPHAGAPGCHGHGCAHDFSVVRWDASAREWTDIVPGGDPQATRDHLAFGRTVRAVEAGEVVACWRNYPDHRRTGNAWTKCECDRQTGRSRCDRESADDTTADGVACRDIIRRSGNFVIVMADDGHAITYVNLASGSIPPRLCPNGLDRILPESIVPRDAFAPTAYLTSTDPSSSPRPRVDEGEPLGTVGDNGNATSPHLHLQAVRFRDRADGNFDQIALLELLFDEGEFLPVSKGASSEWRSLAGHSLNELHERHGSLVIRPRRRE